LLAISRRFSTLIDAKPRLDVLIFRSSGSLEEGVVQLSSEIKVQAWLQQPLAIDWAFLVSEMLGPVGKE
jgi:hypothetical protein